MYTVEDPSGLRSSAQVTVTVNNDAPVAAPDTGAVRPGQSVTLAVLGNDTDANGDALTLVDVDKPDHGTVEVVGDEVVYRADVHAPSVVDSFDYRVRDARKAESTGTVSVTVAPVDLHLVLAQGQSNQDEVELTARVTGYPEGGNLAVTITGQAVNAVVGSSLPENCVKPGNKWVCPLVGSGELAELTVTVDIRGKERELRFEADPTDFTEDPAAALPNFDVWP